MADDEQRLAQQVYLVIKADVTADRKNRNSQVLGVYFADNTALSRAQAEFIDVLKETANLDEDAEVDLEEYSQPGDEHLLFLQTKVADKDGLFVSVRVEEHRVLDFADVFETPEEEEVDDEEFEGDEGGDDDGEDGDPEGDQEELEGEEDEEEEEEPPTKVARKRG